MSWFACKSAAKDLRRLAKDPFALLLWLGIPLVIGFLITLATGGASGPAPKVRLLIADQDDSFVSNLLRSSLGRAGDLIDAEDVELAAGREQMDAGGASALLQIPAGFGDAFLRETPVELRLWTNPAERILPAIAEQFLEVLVDGSFYLHRVFGRELRAFAAGPPPGDGGFPDVQVALLSVSINKSMRRLDRYLFPPVIELQADASADGDNTPGVSYGLLFFPGVVLMALFFTAQGLSQDIWVERRQRTLHRIVCGSQRLELFLAGKVVAGVVVLFGVSAITLVLGGMFHGIGWGAVLLATLWATWAGAALLLALLLIQLYASSERAGAVLSNMILFPLLMIGGSFFAFEAMPGWMAAIGRLTPNGWALEVLKDILLGRDGGTPLLFAIALVGAGSAIVFVACCHRLRRGFVQP